MTEIPYPVYSGYDNAEFVRTAGNPHPTTVWRWEKKGLLKPIIIGTKRMYKVSDIEKLLS